MLNNFQSVSPPVNIPSQPTPESDTAHPRRSAYAAMSDLQAQFSVAGIETEQVWEFIKTEYSVDSRSKLTGKQWATIACQLQSARRDAHMFKIFVDGIPDSYFRIHVFSDDASVPIGRPRDLRNHHISSEWGDFQALATDNQCTITVTQGKRTTYFEPKPVRPTAPVSTVESPKMPSEQHQKPAIALETNTRGEVLSAWGEVMEVRA